MPGGVTGKKIHEKNKLKFSNSSKRISLVAIYWYIVRVWTERLLVLS